MVLDADIFRHMDFIFHFTLILSFIIASNITTMNEIDLKSVDAYCIRTVGRIMATRDILG